MKLDVKEISDVILAIAKARAAGRPLIPLVGAGLSFESGVPTIYELTRYFAYLRAYVFEQAYLPKAFRQGKKKHPLEDRAADYPDNLRLFVTDFGWPSSNDLFDGLWRLDRDKRDIDPLRQWNLDEEAVRQLDHFALKIHPGRYQALPAVGSQTPGRSWRWDAVAEWTDLVRHVTAFDDDLATRLFTRLESGRRPSLGHRCLAFLARLCSIKLFLSVPLGDLLEQALWDEGVPHRAYLVGEGNLPDPALVGGSLAVLKLFGNASQPVLGEQYETPVTEHFLSRLRSVLPGKTEPSPLLLVLGCSGRGRRVMDLVERAFLKSTKEELRVIWLHYERERPQTVLDLAGKYGPRIRAACVNSPGLFLRHLYSSLTSRHHAATEPYDALERRPTPLIFEPSLVGDSSIDFGVREYATEVGSLLLFNNLRPVQYGDEGEDAKGVLPTSPTASERLAEWMNERDGFIPIWVDLEGQYTLRGVVGAIIDQCRLHDPDIAPAVLPLDESVEGEPDLSERQRLMGVPRLCEALRRGRYAVALDGLEMLPWPHTSHHGITSGDREVGRTERLLKLIVEMIAGVSGDSMALKSSRLAVSVNWSSGRHNKKHEDKISAALLRCVSGPERGLIHLCRLQYLRTFLDPSRADRGLTLKRRRSEIWVRAADAIHQRPELGTTHKTAHLPDLVLFVVSCFRRTRGLVALRSILGPLPLGGAGPEELGPYAQVDGVLQSFVEAGYFIPLEGGLYWMKRPIRDRIYSENSSATTTEEIYKSFRKPREDERGERDLTIQQLIVLALHHDRIARHYYAETFTQSKDPLAFFEYVYHRVSSIRYLTKLDLVLEAAWLRYDESNDVDPTKNKDASLPETPQSVQDICTTLAALLPITDDYLQCGRSGRDKADWLANGAELRAEVKVRRLHQIKSLRVAWEAAADILQTRVPAEHLISWYRWLLEDDLQRFLTGYYAKKHNASEKWRNICGRLDGNRIRTAWWDLRDTLYDLWARSCRERGDPRGLIHLCEKYFTSVRMELDQPAMEPPGTTCLAILDAAIQVCKADEPGQASKRIAWPDLLEVCNDQWQPRSDGPPAPKRELNWPVPPSAFFRDLQTRLLDLAEGLPLLGDTPLLDAMTKYLSSGTGASLRCSALRAEAALRQKNCKALSEIAETALRETRQIDFTERHAAERFPYFRYWSLFLQYRARARWNKESSGLPTPELELDFKLAYRDLEMARGRSEMTPSRTAQAQIDLAAAECANAHARKYLQPGAQPEAANKAAAKLDIAAGYLRRALDHLQHGRRNVIWWHDYYRLFAEYKACRNACRLAQLGAPGKIALVKTSLLKWAKVVGSPDKMATVWKTLPSFTRSLRQGLAAVGQVLDLTLEGTKDPILETRGLLVTDAWRMGALALAAKGQPAEGEDPLSQFKSGLVAVNEYVKDLAGRSDAGDAHGTWPSLPS